MNAWQQLLAAATVGTATVAVGIGAIAAAFATIHATYPLGRLSLDAAGPRQYYLSEGSGRLFDVLALAVVVYVLGRFLTPAMVEWAPLAGGRVRWMTMPVGALTLAWLVLLFWNGPLDWATATTMASLPLWWIAASSHMRYPRLRLGPIGLVLCGFAVASTAGGFLLGLRQVPQSTPTLSSTGEQAKLEAFRQKLETWDHGTDVIAAPVPPNIAAAIPSPPFDSGDATVTYDNLVVVDLGALDGWHDLRVEAWRLSTDDDYFWVVDRTARAPVTVGVTRLINGLTTPDGDDLRRRGIDVSKIEGAMLLSGSVTLRPTHEAGYAIAVTGVAPDGRRYLLAQPWRRLSRFNGTLLDWFESALAGT
jgi:hypothetical protein